MIVVLSQKATKKNLSVVVEKLKNKGYDVDISAGRERTIVGAIGPNPENKEALMAHLNSLSYVERVVPILKPYKKVSRENVRERTVVEIAKGLTVGGPEIAIMAGPCAVEGREAIVEVAKALKKKGVKILRAGAYKPRTSPYSFQGYGAKGLEMLQAAKDATGMAIATEVVEARDVTKVAKYADILQIGTRNMQNFNLLKECGQSGKPTLLKRGMSATIEEWLLAAEYISKEGNKKVILCERGIRTFETYTRNTLDLNAVAAVKTLSHLPVVVDPSHGTGRRELVIPMARAAIATGADGLMVEVHPKPEDAFSDGQQTLTLKEYGELKTELQPIAMAMGRKLK